MAFTDINARTALWGSRGLHWLLQKDDVSKAAFLLHVFPQKSTSAISPQNIKHSQIQRRKKALCAPTSENVQRPSEQHGLQKANVIPQHRWPVSWRNRFDATRKGRVAWTYAQLGQDLLGMQTDGLEKRRNFLQNLLRDLGHPAGTHTFWPAMMPADPDAAFKPAPGVFWSGAKLLGARVVVALGASVAEMLELPENLLPMQQILHQGFLIWFFWDVESMLADSQRYDAMLTCLRQSLQDIVPQ